MPPLFHSNTDNAIHCILHPGRADLLLRLAARLHLQGGLAAMTVLANTDLDAADHFALVQHDSLSATYIPCAFAVNVVPATSGELHFGQGLT